MRVLTPSKSRIFKLRSKGLSWGKIAKIYNVRKATLLKIAKGFGIDTAKIVRKPLVKKLSQAHRKAISEGLKEYWKDVHYQLRITADFYNEATNKLKKGIKGYSKAHISRAYITKEETDPETGLTAYEEALRHGQIIAGGYNWKPVDVTIKIKILRYTPKIRGKAFEAFRAKQKRNVEITLASFDKDLIKKMQKEFGYSKAQVISIIKKTPKFKNKITGLEASE